MLLARFATLAEHSLLEDGVGCVKDDVDAGEAEEDHGEVEGDYLDERGTGHCCDECSTKGRGD